MKNVDDVANAILILQNNVENDFEKILVQDFVASLLEQKRQKICPACGKIFLPTTPVQKFCSKKCRFFSNNYQRYLVEKTCLNCGKKFFSNKFFKRRFCSVKCANQFNFKKR